MRNEGARRVRERPAETGAQAHGAAGPFHYPQRCGLFLKGALRRRPPRGGAAPWRSGAQDP